MLGHGRNTIVTKSQFLFWGANILLKGNLWRQITLMKNPAIFYLKIQKQSKMNIFFKLFFFYLWWILSYIEMKQPWVYMCSPSQSPLPPPSPPVPCRFSQCTRSERLSHASNLGWWSVSPYIIYMFQCCSLETSHPCLLPQSLKDCSINLCLFFF